MLRILGLAVAAVVLVGCAGSEYVSFPTEDGGVVHAEIYGNGDRGVVLAHGGRFDKESWATQAQALAKAGLRALAIDFRGRGQSQGADPRSPLWTTFTSTFWRQFATCMRLARRQSRSLAAALEVGLRLRPRSRRKRARSIALCYWPLRRSTSPSE